MNDSNSFVAFLGTVVIFTAVLFLFSWIPWGIASALYKPKIASANAKAIAASGLSPLDFFIQVMRDEQRDHSQRLEAAKAAAPFCHARLTSIEHGGQSGSPIEVVFSESDKRLL